MNEIHIKYLMGQKYGISTHYYKPQGYVILEDYLKAVESLTIERDLKAATLLQKQVSELAEKNEEQNYIIKGRLAEKEKESQEMKKQLEDFKTNHEQTKKELTELINSREQRFEKYMNEILEVRQMLTSPFAVLPRFYTPNDPAVKWVEEFTQEKEEEIKRKLRNDYKNPSE